jgi:hypothetical protein
MISGEHFRKCICLSFRLTLFLGSGGNEDAVVAVNGGILSLCYANPLLDKLSYINCLQSTVVGPPRPKAGPPYFQGAFARALLTAST